MKKIIYITGTRAEYGLMKRTLLELNKRADLTVIVTCMHLSPRFGSTFKEIEKDAFKIKKVDMLIDSDSLGAMVKSFAIGTYGITQAIEEIKPDLIFVEGDRGESLSGAIAGAHLNIPIVHHGGGDLGGSIDNKVRYAITMFSDYHLVGNKESYNRLITIGIPKHRVFDIGEPGVEAIYDGDFTSKDEIIKKYNIDTKRHLIILIQHPNTQEHEYVELQIKETIEAIKELKIQTIAIYSNADAGGRVINKMLEGYARKIGFLTVYPVIERREFLGLMNVCDVIIGNSSSALVEASCFGLPAVNIGTRQSKRKRAENVIDVHYDREEIKKAVIRAINDKDFRDIAKNCVRPYIGKKVSQQIVDFLLNVKNK